MGCGSSCAGSDANIAILVRTDKIQPYKDKIMSVQRILQGEGKQQEGEEAAGTDIPGVLS